MIKDRLGRIVEDIESIREPHDGKDLRLSVDSQNSIHCVYHLEGSNRKHKAKAGGAIVLDVHTGEVLALVNCRPTSPNDRANLTGAQLRNRVMTDTFELARP